MLAPLAAVLRKGSQKELSGALFAPLAEGEGGSGRGSGRGALGYGARGMSATHASARAAAAALALGACAAQSVINPGGGYDAPVGGYCRGPCACIGARARIAQSL